MMSGCGCDDDEINPESVDQQGALRWLLAVNATMFVGEFGTGLLSQSTALIADSLDMFADAAVYSVSLYAVGRTALHKARAASISGVLQVLLALFALAEVVRRLFMGSEPESAFMMVVGLVALIANVSCLAIIAKHREGGVHMRASWIFSTNDVIANIGVILGGALVHWFGSRWPDLIIGLAVGLVVLRGGVQILREAREAKRMDSDDACPLR